MHVAAQPQDIGVLLDQPGAVAALQEMPATIVTAVEVDGVGRFETVHELPEVGPRRLDHQVDVVGHEAEQVQTRLEPLDALAEHAQKPLAVGVIVEDRPPFVAPGRHVIHGPFVFDPLRPRHTVILSGRRPQRNPVKA